MILRASSQGFALSKIGVESFSDIKTPLFLPLFPNLSTGSSRIRELSSIQLRKPRKRKEGKAF
jgi:hypothetical protein